MKEKNLYYEVSVLGETLEDLRKGDGKNKITLDDLSELIEEKTGESISKTTLSKYENAKELGNMRVANLIALANTYNVSLEYLFKKTPSKKYALINQAVAKKFSLSDASMNRLERLTKNKDYFKLKLINFIIEDNLFINILYDKLIGFYNATDNKYIKKDTFKEEYGISSLDIARSSLIKAFEDFVEDSYKKLWYKEQPKLFNIPK